MTKTTLAFLALVLSASASLACQPVRPGSSVVECRTPAQVTEGKAADAIRAKLGDRGPVRFYGTILPDWSPLSYQKPSKTHTTKGH